MPASVGSIVSEDGEIQDAEVRAQWRKEEEKARSEISDSVREKEKRQERAREKTLAMTCGRSIVRPASVSRSETLAWGESGVRKFGGPARCLCPAGRLARPQRRGVHRRGCRPLKPSAATGGLATCMYLL